MLRKNEGILRQKAEKDILISLTKKDGSLGKKN